MNTRNTQFFLFEADDGCSTDLDKIEEYMIWAKGIFSSIFPNIFIEKATLVIYDHPKTINSGGKVDCCTMRSDPPNKTIYLLCPSVCKNKTEEYYRKNLLHEYTHLFTYRRKYPRWFIEGIAENVAVIQSNDPKISKQYNYYFTGIKQQILNKQLSFGNNMSYSWAIHLIKFLLNKNPQGIKLLLEENGLTFEGDLKRVYGFNLNQLLDLFWDWIRSTFSLNIDKNIRGFPLLAEIEKHL